MTQRRFTGWHMSGIMVAMFATIIAVNFVMAYFAVTTFGGTVVDSSYVATRNYNRWLAEAQRQEALGWRVAATLDPHRRVRITAVTPKGPIDGAVSAVANHPLGRARDHDIEFMRTGDGRYVATHPLPAGRWKLKITVRIGKTVARFTEDIAA